MIALLLSGFLWIGLGYAAPSGSMLEKIAGTAALVCFVLAYVVNNVGPFNKVENREDV